MAASLVLLMPASAQFWGDSWGGRQQRGWRWLGRLGSGRGRLGSWRRGPARATRENREAPVDFSRAPGGNAEERSHHQHRGDRRRDGRLARLRTEDALCGKARRRHRAQAFPTDSGLIRYDPRRDNVDWAQAIREMIAADKPKFIVMMVGGNDRQAIRERAPVVCAPGAGNREARCAGPDHHPRYQAAARRRVAASGDAEAVRRPSRAASRPTARGSSRPRSGKPPISSASMPRWRR